MTFVIAKEVDAISDEPPTMPRYVGERVNTIFYHSYVIPRPDLAWSIRPSISSSTHRANRKQDFIANAGKRSNHLLPERVISEPSVFFPFFLFQSLKNP